MQGSISEKPDLFTPAPLTPRRALSSLAHTNCGSIDHGAKLIKNLPSSQSEEVNQINHLMNSKCNKSQEDC